MKRLIIIGISMLVIFMIIASFTYQVQALGLDALGNPDEYVQSTDNNQAAINIANIIVWIIRTVGIAISVLMLTIIGIKYIMGSVEEKAQYKQTMWPYVIGAVLIFAGSSVVTIIYNIMNQA